MPLDSCALPEEPVEEEVDASRGFRFGESKLPVTDSYESSFLIVIINFRTKNTFQKVIVHLDQQQAVQNVCFSGCTDHLETTVLMFTFPFSQNWGQQTLLFPS